tara:strand:+ start:3477 stop:4076 length:600 start_codon:yes stop_codon:yes gene_type:complete
MNLTVDNIKQLIKEELDKLFESDYEVFINRWNTNISNEPKAWSNERAQYIDLINQGQSQEAVSLLAGDLSTLASILQNVKKEIRPNKIESFFKAINSSEEAKSLMVSYVDYRMQDIANFLRQGGLDKAMEVVVGDSAIQSYWNIRVPVFHKINTWAVGSKSWQDTSKLNEFVKFIQINSSGQFIKDPNTFGPVIFLKEK